MGARGLAGIINGPPIRERRTMRALEQGPAEVRGRCETMLFSFNDLPKCPNRAGALIRSRLNDSSSWARGDGEEFFSTLSDPSIEGRRADARL